jgi:sRNA-binding protein
MNSAVKNNKFNTVKRNLTRHNQTSNKYKRCFYQLEKAYPQLLSLKKPKPLSINIHQDFLNEHEKIGLSKKTIKRALLFYCNSLTYLKSLVVGAERYDINNNVVASVTTEEAEYAIEKLKTVTEKLQVNKQNNKQNNKQKYRKQGSDNKQLKPKKNQVVVRLSDIKNKTQKHHTKQKNNRLSRLFCS